VVQLGWVFSLHDPHLIQPLSSTLTTFRLPAQRVLGRPQEVHLSFEVGIGAVVTLLLASPTSGWLVATSLAEATLSSVGLAEVLVQLLVLAGLILKGGFEELLLSLAFLEKVGLSLLGSPLLFSILSCFIWIR